MINRITISILGIILILSSSYSGFGQDDKLTKQVQVVRPYEPSISDAFKLNLLPQVEDTIRVVPTFAYNITLRPVTIDFPITFISPARMIAEPLARASWGYAKVGFGNYASPLAEVFVANTRSEKYSYGGSFKYKGSFGNVKLDNGDKVDADFNRVGVSAFGKRIFKKSVLDGGVDYSYFGYGFFGNDTTLAALPLPAEVDLQNQKRFNIGVNYYSTHSDSTHLNYRIGGRFANFADKFDNRQNTFALTSNLDKFFKIEKVGGSVSMVHHGNTLNDIQSNQTLLSLAPWIGLFGKQWRTQAGVSAVISINEFGTQTHFYPIAQLSYDIVGNYVIPYFQFSGYLEDNNYSKIISENPWVLPGLDVANTSHKLIIKGGVKGNMSARVSYNIAGSFSLIDSAYFFVNTIDPTNAFLGNTFDVVYDNIRHKNLVGELTITPTSSMKLALQAEYNIFTMNNLNAAWHKPDYLGRAILSYNIKDKILLNAAFYLEGKRNVQALNGDILEIDGVMDLNLGLEYRLNKRVSAYLNFNNITANRYHLWYLYPAHRFNMRGGITYAF